MAILVDGDTKVLCQGITGSFGALHTKGCLNYGTRMAGGVTPGRGGEHDTNDLPIFDTVADAVAGTQATATMVFVPPPFAADAILEAAAAGISVICAITEGIPTQDMIRAKSALRDFPEARMIGPNCPGIISPGRRVAGEGADAKFEGGCKIGIMPGYIHKPSHNGDKAVGIISRSGTLTYEAVWQCSTRDIAQSTCVGIGGDPVSGTTFVDVLELFNDDPETEAIVLIGEIGGTKEQQAAAYIKEHVRKPVASLIVGQTAPPGRRMGHAGAVITGEAALASAKVAALQDAGCHIIATPADIGSTVAAMVGG